jgi:hypothetical protein
LPSPGRVGLRDGEDCGLDPTDSCCDLALRLLRNAGRAHSEDGSAALATAVSLVYTHYF